MSDLTGAPTSSQPVVDAVVAATNEPDAQAPIIDDNAIEPATRGAGILFVAPDGTALFLKRGPGGDFPGAWCLPGGTIEDGETREEAAKREAVEELGFLPEGDRYELARSRVVPGVEFTTYCQKIGPKFEPELNGEHTGWAWSPLTDPPEPLHPGVRVALARYGADELGVARMMAAGELTSPQVYENVALFVIRITGTGMAYRTKWDEYVFRDPELYLNADFLARCNGLPVIFEHPKTGMLTSEEFNDRVVGTVFLPYQRGNEIWAVVKIYDRGAIELMSTQRLSTSPAVQWSNGELGTELTMANGSKLLVEERPVLLDHIAICEAGVWDKGEAPAGVTAVTVEDGERVMPEEKEVTDRKDAAGEGGTEPDKLLARLDSMFQGLHGRMDAMEKRLDAHRRKDDDDDDRRGRKDARRRKDDDDDDRRRKDARGRRGDDDDDRRDDDDDDDRRDDDDDDDRKDARHRGRKDDDDDDDRKDSRRRGRKDDDDDDRRRKDARGHRKDDDDDDRKDAEEGDEPEEPEPVAADKRRGRKDDDRRGRKDSSDLNALRRRLDAMEGRLPAQRSDDERAALADVQARADSVYAAHGKSAPRPLDGEDLNGYRRRLAKQLQEHSPTWKATKLTALDDAAFSVAEKQVYDEALAAARNPLPGGEGCYPVVSKDATGRQITTFYGRPSWMRRFGATRRRVSGFSNRGQ